MNNYIIIQNKNKMENINVFFQKNEIKVILFFFLLIKKYDIFIVMILDLINMFYR